MKPSPTPSEDLSNSHRAEIAAAVEPDESSLNRYKKVALTTVFLGAAALSLTETGPIIHDIEKDAVWFGSAVGATEAIAWGGASIMLASAGNKIGNPLTVKKRLNAIKDRLAASRMYRTGAYVTMGGAAGTSSLLAAETFKDLPINAWPLSLGAAVLSVAMPYPFLKIARQSKIDGKVE